LPAQITSAGLEVFIFAAIALVSRLALTNIIDGDQD